jgi:DNA-binding NtrC family response regulator
MPKPPPTAAVAAEATTPTLPLAADAVLPDRVLLLDDEPDSLAACSAWLRAHGIAVQTASTAAEAEAALFGKGAEVDVFICDYRLAHGADGLAYALDVRARKDQALPVVMVTGETSPTRLQLLREAGLDVLFKPVHADDLIRVLARITANKGSAVPRAVPAK